MTAAERFAAHAASCTRCGTVELAKPATCANTCLAGASLALEAARELERERKKQRRRDEDDTAMGGGSR